MVTIQSPQSPIKVVPAGFFVLRTPLLPFEEVMKWTEGIQVLTSHSLCEPLDSWKKIVSNDCVILRDRLLSFFQQPVIQEAISLASPSVHNCILTCRKNPETKDGIKAQRTLVRYFLRMAARPSPFGLFAGITLGQIDLKTRLVIPCVDSCTQHSRISYDCLTSIAANLEKDPQIRRNLSYFPNDTFFQKGKQWRGYVPSDIKKNGSSFQQIVVKNTPLLKRVLCMAKNGVTIHRLVHALAKKGDKTHRIQLKAFVNRLIDHHLLISNLCPNLTGLGAAESLVSNLTKIKRARPLAKNLQEVMQKLKEKEHVEIGKIFSSQENVLADKSTLFCDSPSYSFQVDLQKPINGCCLGDPVVAEIFRGVEVLRGLTKSSEVEALSRFRDAFVNRYGEQEVPLLEALDFEIGIGEKFSDISLGQKIPVLQGIDFRKDKSHRSFKHYELVCIKKLWDVWRTGGDELLLTSKEIQEMAVDRSKPFPSSFSVLASVVSTKKNGDDQGDFRVLLRRIIRPSCGGISRFCYLNDDMLKVVKNHLQMEQEAYPNAVFAEVVYLPSSSAGNVLQRPSLYEYEIPILGGSGVSPDKQIKLEDIFVSVRNDQIILRSQRLGAQIIPRSTTTHDYGHVGNMPLYRFLSLLHHQDDILSHWIWEGFSTMPFLPRVVVGKIVLSPARWVLFEDEIHCLVKGELSEQVLAFEQLCKNRNLPRFVMLDHDHEGWVADLKNPLVMDTLVSMIRNRKQIVFWEVYPRLSIPAAHSNEGLYMSEVIVPFLTSSSEKSKIISKCSTGARRSDQKSFSPGSEWIYQKLYCGCATADQILINEVAEVVEQIRRSNIGNLWFFIRYKDEIGFHLRLRFHGNSGKIVPLLHKLGNHLLATGMVWKVQFDTYDREVDRYGGPKGITWAEKIFTIDSQSVIGLLKSLPDQSTLVARWFLLLKGIDDMLSLFGLDYSAKKNLLIELQNGFWNRYHEKNKIQHSLGLKFREERDSLDKMLLESESKDYWVQASKSLLRNRFFELKPNILSLLSQLKKNKLTRSCEDLAMCFVHMYVNRLNISSEGELEFVAYHILSRWYEGQIARKKNQYSSLPLRQE